MAPWRTSSVQIRPNLNLIWERVENAFCVKESIKRVVVNPPHFSISPPPFFSSLSFFVFFFSLKKRRKRKRKRERKKEKERERRRERAGRERGAPRRSHERDFEKRWTCGEDTVEEKKREGEDGNQEALALP